MEGAMATTDPLVLADGAEVEFKRVENVHQARFAEFFLVHRKPESGNLVAEVYNTMYTTEGIPDSKDTAPEERFEGLDFDKIKDEYGVLGASLNGPKLCLPDWCDIEAGVERQFGGVAAVWVAQLDLGDSGGGMDEHEPYSPVTIARNSSLGWKKGTRVVLLDDADGNTWIMKGFELGLQPKHSYEEFVANAAEMFEHLPAGWKVRVEVLERDLTETPENGIATIMADEHFNVYDKTGPGMSDFTP
jgi:hypothetical protein